MLNGLHREVMGSAIIELLAKKSPQRRFTESLIEAALERDVFLNEHILLEGGKSIKMENLLKSRYFKRTVEKVKDVLYIEQSLKKTTVMHISVLLLSRHF